MIREAAAEVFSRKGYHNATVDEIARAAGYSAAAIYKYFRNKDEVFIEVMEALAERSLGLFAEPVPRSLGFRERMRWFLVRSFGNTEETREIFFTFVTQRTCFEWDTSSEIGERAHAFYMRYLDHMSELMAEGIEDGTLRAGDPDEYAQAFVGICNAFVFSWLMARQPAPLDRSIDTILSIFFEGVATTTTSSNEDTP